MDTVDIGGRQYVSAKVAARSNGYTMDYIGQLIRAHKLQGQKIGRAWFVNVDSLSDYLSSLGAEASPIPAPVQETAVPVLSPVAVRQPVHVAATTPSVSESSAADEAFSLRYLPDEEPLLPPVIEKTSQTGYIAEQSVPVRAIYAPAYEPVEEEMPEIKPRISPDVSHETKIAPHFHAKKGKLYTGAVAFAAVIFVLAATLFGALTSRTVHFNGAEITAGVTFSQF
jgi:hypothetical protein